MAFDVAEVAGPTDEHGTLREMVHKALDLIIDNMGEGTDGGAALVGGDNNLFFKLIFYSLSNQEECAACHGTGVAGSRGAHIHGAHSGH